MNRLTWFFSNESIFGLNTWAKGYSKFKNYVFVNFIVTILYLSNKYNMIIVMSVFVFNVVAKWRAGNQYGVQRHIIWRLTFQCSESVMVLMVLDLWLRGPREGFNNNRFWSAIKTHTIFHGFWFWLLNQFLKQILSVTEWKTQLKNQI